MSVPVIVAAGPGVTCMVISVRNVQDDNAGRATAREHLVAAWQVWPGDAVGIDWHVEPVLAMHIVAGNDLVLMPLPSGGWHLPWDAYIPPDAGVADLVASVEATDAADDEARERALRDEAAP